MNLFYEKSLFLHNSYRIKSVTKMFASPKNLKDLIQTLVYLKKNNIKYFVLGDGSNILIDNYDGCVISMENFNNITIKNDSINLQSGCILQNVVDKCIIQRVSCLENFYGMPGTIGGGIYMNSSCYSVSYFDLILTVTYLDSNDLQVKHINIQDCFFAYKISPFTNTKHIILSASFKSSFQDKDYLFSLTLSRMNDRLHKGHYDYPNCGSVFKNNRAFGLPSGKIIEQAGLLDYCIGGARVYKKHGNFVINYSNATYNDVKNIVYEIKDKVMKKSGFLLEEELLYIK